MVRESRTFPRQPSEGARRPALDEKTLQVAPLNPHWPGQNPFATSAVSTVSCCAIYEKESESPRKIRTPMSIRLVVAAACCTSSEVMTTPQ